MGNYRETIEGPGRLLPECLMVGHARIRLARVPGLAAHHHRSAFELFFLEQGEAEWWVEKEVVQIKANDIYVNKPGEVHGSVGHSLKPCSYYWVQLAFSRGRRLPGVPPREAATWFQELLALEPRSFPGTPELNHCFRRLFDELRHPEPGSRMIARATLHLLVATLLRAHRNHVHSARRRADLTFAIRRVLRWIDGHVAEPVPVQKLAGVAGLSVSRFRERFLQEVGLSPHDYLLRRRIAEAKRRLGQGRASVTEVAHGLAFSSSQYFATVFKRLEGLNPREFRAQARDRALVPER